jgi:hypothetical protein
MKALIYLSPWLAGVAFCLTFCCGCRREARETSDGGNKSEEANPVMFVSGFNPQIRIPLSTGQAVCISRLAHRLTLEGKHTEVDPGMQYGSFWIGTEERRWAGTYFFVPDKKRRGWIYLSDDLLKNMSQRLDTVGKNPYDFTAGDWSTVLLVLESKGK